MAKTKIKSPNIIFSETDKSAITVNPEIADFCIIGTTPFGRAFIPTLFSSYNDYIKQFGYYDIKKLEEYVGFTVNSTLNGTNASVMVISVMGTEDYTVGKAVDIVGSKDDFTGSIAQFYLTSQGITDGIDGFAVSATPTYGDIKLQLKSGSTVVETLNYSLSPSTNGSISSVTDLSQAISDSNRVYLKYYAEPSSSLSSGATFSITTSSAEITMPSYQEGLSPWVISQTYNGTNHNLFRFESISQGEQVNRQFKISIINVELPSERAGVDITHGKFDVIIRKYDDDDSSVEALEIFSNVTLDPSDTNFIGNRIGTVKDTFNQTSGQIESEGDYNNRSSYVRVVLGNIDDIPNDAVPFGFDGYAFGFNANDSFDNLLRQAALTSTTGDDYYSGVNFDSKSKTLGFIHTELPKSNSPFYTTQATPFLLSNSDITLVPKNNRKFTFGIFGATNGISKSTKKLIGANAVPSNTFGLDFSSITGNGYLGYKKALDLIADKDNVLLKTVALVGLNLTDHANVYNYAFNVASERGDIFIPADVTKPIANSTNALSTMESSMEGAFDTSFGCGLTPWQKVNNVLVPMVSVFLRTLAKNDEVSAPWYSPLGFERGVVSGIPYTKFSLSQRDDLDDLRVNTVVKFAGEPNAVLLNDRTLLKRESSLSSINVRRLLNEAKIEINFIARKYIGRPLTPSTRNALAGEIRSYLSFIQANNGLETFEAIFDESINTPDIVDQAIIQGVIYLVPIRAVRGISIGFVIGSSGTSFNEG